jgi:hypothetical protein
MQTQYYALGGTVDVLVSIHDALGKCAVPIASNTAVVRSISKVNYQRRRS